MRSEKCRAFIYIMFVKYQMIDPLQIHIYPPLDHVNDDPIKY